MLSNYLLSELDLLIYESLLVFSIRVVVVPVYWCGDHFDIVSLSVRLSDFERMHDRFDSFFS